MALKLRLELDARPVLAGFDDMRRASRELGSVFREIRPVMRADQKDHASKAAGPDGKWAPRAASTLGRMSRGSRRFKGTRRRKLSRRPLGRLVTAVTYSASKAGVFATSRVAWSNVHQEGGRVGRGARLPARPFLWISDSLADTAARAIAEHVAGAMGGR